MSKSVGAHILLFPYPAQGHVLPLLDLAHQLAIRRLTITILITPKNLPILTPLLSQHPPSSIQPLILPFPSHPCIPPGVENVKDLPIMAFRAMMRALSELSYPITTWFNSHPSPPIAIISDIFLGWTHHLATQIGIPRIVFSPSGALAINLVDSLWLDLPNQPSDPNVPISFPNLPNSPNYPWWQLSNVYRSYVQGGPESEFIKDGMLANLKGWGVVYNTFTELESVDLAFKKKVLGHDRVWAVGPLCSPTSSERGGASTVEADGVISWLDTCQEHSVVYVSFGSQAVLSNKQMEELANGLDRSGVRFVWAVKEATKGHVEGEYGKVPDGFEDRTAGRGIVIRGWAPQVMILSHKAVGSMLTHCGWNSVLEAIVAGVPMFAWPMGADQFMNATLLVDQIGVAVRVCEGATTIPDAGELARKLGEDQSGRRAKAMELANGALNAVKDGGSSWRQLDGLVKHLVQLNSHSGK